MTYEETLEFLYSQLPAYHRIGKAAYKEDLSNSVSFDNHLGSPHRNYKTIHVGGTNGKGSVSHILASVFMEAGYKTGLYTSPHLVDFRERIKINGKMIPKIMVVNFLKKHSSFIEKLKPSFFEMTVALAFDFFSREKVDVAVIEVGLGGRLDSTNIITPVLSVITNIGHDHMDLLGDTVEKVSIEKAGIIKQGVPVVIGETQELTSGVFNRKASDAGSPVYFADSRYSCSLDESDYSSDQRSFRVRDTITGIIASGTIPLMGDYQTKNIQTVFQCCNVIGREFRLSGKNILDGINNVVSNTGLAGRWQVIGRDPLVVCDTGHNLEGLQYVLGQIARIKRKRVHFVIGFVNDKDLAPVLPLFPEDAYYYFTKASVPRALNEEILKEKASAFGLQGASFSDVASAMRSARRNAGAGDLIFVGGSTFIVADAIGCL
jgi:dihydrofolate synthase/folylpolyglutamate synthase